MQFPHCLAIICVYSSAAVRESDSGDGTRNIEVHSPTSDTAQEEIKREQPANEKMSLQVTPDQKNDDRSWQTRSRIGKCSIICEVVVLILVMLVIIGLFQIPTVYYILDVAVSLWFCVTTSHSYWPIHNHCPKASKINFFE